MTAQGSETRPRTIRVTDTPLRLSSESVADGRQVGRVAEIGVRPRWRSQGLGYAILLHSFHILRQRGATTIVLDVDAENVTSALRLYVKAGMTPQPAFTIWELML